MFKRISLLSLILFLTGTLASSQAQTPKYVGWSTGYYTSWSQGGYPPSRIPWKAFTHICHFSLGPNSDGTIRGLGGTASTTLITEAHKNNVKVLVCVGGAGSGTNFGSAASDANRGKFISNIIKFMKQYNYDGVDLDWEELNGKGDLYVKLHKEMRDSLNTITPRPLFTVAMADYLATVCGQIWTYVDQMNSMTYWTTAANLDKDMKPVTDKGVPKSILGVGMGFATEDGELDITPQACKDKILYCLNNGYGGIMQWAIDKDASRNGGATPCLDTIAHYVPPYTPTAVFFPGQDNLTMQGATMFLTTDRVMGLKKITYTIPAAGAFVDAGLYTMRGALVQKLVHGYNQQGVHDIVINANNSAGTGTYIVKLSTDAKTETAKTFILR